jgi:uncharacterized surface protein with fasciclin (FAS1) repeats
MSAKPDFAAAAKPGSLTIVGIVLQDDGEFDVLQAAVVRAGLASALDGPRQYTVFAPTDNAFVTALGVDDEAAAIAAVNGLPIEKLTDILLFHVTAGRRHSRSVLAAPSYEMLNGATLVRQQLVAAGLAATDISASNGIVHVINAVLVGGTHIADALPLKPVLDPRDLEPVAGISIQIHEWNRPNRRPLRQGGGGLQHRGGGDCDHSGPTARSSRMRAAPHRPHDSMTVGERDCVGGPPARGDAPRF